MGWRPHGPAGLETASRPLTRGPRRRLAAGDPEPDAGMREENPGGGTSDISARSPCSPYGSRRLRPSPSAIRVAIRNPSRHPLSESPSAIRVALSGPAFTGPCHVWRLAEDSPTHAFAAKTEVYSTTEMRITQERVSRPGRVRARHAERALTTRRSRWTYPAQGSRLITSNTPLQVSPSAALSLTPPYAHAPHIHAFITAAADEPHRPLQRRG